MNIFPTGLLVAFFALTIGVLVWQRLAHYSFVAMGLMRTPPPPPDEVRAKGLRFLIGVGSAWFAIFTGCAIAFAVSPGSPPVGVFLFAGVAAVPVVVAPGALRALRRFDRHRSKGTS